jgi:hypothetical protein
MDSRSSSVARYRRAPVSNAENVSKTETSKVTEANPSTRSAGVRSKSSRVESIRLTTPRCASSTPFGLPVLPEV